MKISYWHACHWNKFLVLFQNHKRMPKAHYSIDPIFYTLNLYFHFHFLFIISFLLSNFILLFYFSAMFQHLWKHIIWTGNSPIAKSVPYSKWLLCKSERCLIQPQRWITFAIVASFVYCARWYLFACVVAIVIVDQFFVVLMMKELFLYISFILSFE